MSNLSFNLNQNDQTQYDLIYQKYLVKSQNQYIKYVLKIGDTKISFFYSNKVLLQGKNVYDVFLKIFPNYQILADEIITKNEQPQKSNDKTQSDADLDFQKFDVIGSDEVGVGDYFGGLVVCAVLVNQKTYAFLKKMRITDSKKLTDQYMLEIYDKLKQKLNFYVAEFLPKDYNLFIDKYKNAHLAKAYLHHKAITNLKMQTNQPTYVIIDEFVNPNKLSVYFKQLNLTPLKIDYSTPKAEAIFIAVAAASIIARVHFLKQMEKLSKTIGLKLPLGA